MNTLSNIEIRLLDSPEDLKLVEDLQRIIWPGNDIEIVPVHIFRASVHNGGIILGAFFDEKLIGFVFGFPGYGIFEGKRQIFHASHMAGVHPEFRNAGLGYKLKRAQWQMVRRQGIERITWTYDPLQSRNANLNLSKLGAVCNTYIPNYYGEMRDGLNIGMPSDRFQVDWWVNSNRVRRRLSKRKQQKITLSQYLDAGIPIINPAIYGDNGLLMPGKGTSYQIQVPMLLLEIPPDIQSIKQADLKLAIQWSNLIREAFSFLFRIGYIATDFIYFLGKPSKSYYVLTDGDATF